MSYERDCPGCGILIEEEYICERWDYPLCDICSMDEDIERVDEGKFYYFVRKGCPEKGEIVR